MYLTALTSTDFYTKMVCVRSIPKKRTEMYSCARHRPPARRWSCSRGMAACHQLARDDGSISYVLFIDAVVLN